MTFYIPPPPNVAAFRSEFPELRDVDDAAVMSKLRFANAFVDPRKISPNPRQFNPGGMSDYAYAILVLTAHYVALQLASDESGQTPGMADTYVNSISFGERRVGFSPRTTKPEPGVGAGEGLLGSTTYGIIYLQIRSRNVAGVAIV